MSVRKLQLHCNTFYYLTFTCFQWISLFEITNFYDYIYKCFDVLNSKEIYYTGYVIMPNHLHALVYTKNTEEVINKTIGNTICNQYNADIIISETVLPFVKWDKNYQYKLIDTVDLRGRKNPVTIYNIISLIH